MLPLFNTAHSCTKIESEGPTAPQTDSSDFHAWAKVFLPVAGWIPVKRFREALDRGAALPSHLHWFVTEVLSQAGIWKV
jgi:hypothetical protein